MKPSNASVIRALRQLVAYTQLEDGRTQSFRTRAYERAIDAVEACQSDVADMSLSQLKAIEGIGDSTARKIVEFAENGKIAKVERLKKRFPPSMLELMRIPGIGPKTALALQEHLDVVDVAGLTEAIDHEQLRKLDGFGAKSEEKIARSIELLGIHSSDSRTPIFDAMQIARAVMTELKTSGYVAEMEYAGSLRRLSETIGDIDILASSQEPEAAIAAFVSLPGVTAILGSGTTKASVVIDDRMQVDLRVVPHESFGAALVYFTGSRAHNIELRQRSLQRGYTLNEYALSSLETGERIAHASESDVYGALGLPWIPPEIREGAGELAAAQAGELQPPIRVEDISGDLHVHSDWSGDGRSTLTEMLDAVVARGLEYVAITDHAEDLAINGLSRAEMVRQRHEIEIHRERLTQLTILHGTELNIGADGTIDYDPDFVEMFDFGVASIHSHFDLGEAEQTSRLIAAMENPAVHVIGHPSGRKIGRRPGVQFNAAAVFEAAAATGTALEINSHLQRLDLAAPSIRRAVEVPGVWFVISTDSHHVSELGNVRWGVSQATKGWVPRDRVLNSLPKREFLALIG